MNKDHSFIYLIGNKLDLEGNEIGMGGSSSNGRQVQYDEAQELAQNKGILFNEVSSLKRKNIELVLKMLRTRTSRLISEYRDLNTALEGGNSKKQFHQLNDESNDENGSEYNTKEESLSGQEYRVISYDEVYKKGKGGSSISNLEDINMVGGGTVGAVHNFNGLHQKELDTAQ